ncbi:hypothetical protein [Brevibacillus laterosporus]|uniref:hypothetical protein n=1 Tax=Brevibacillus laterosporus TaxID=1465 RepID=UPI001A7E77C8|nr:hypothetical protein [Brevibacillus laterosporus]MBG9789191.1 hypothetical protein [Brevibacillus laterosporus]
MDKKSDSKTCCYFVDNKKFEQSNFFYEKSLKDKNLIDVYKKEEEKFIQVFQILWSNCPVYIETMIYARLFWK